MQLVPVIVRSTGVRQELIPAVAEAMINSGYAVREGETAREKSSEEKKPTVESAALRAGETAVLAGAAVKRVWRHSVRGV